jgi:pimeloyl-ACP methyl ester carboxylesterase
MSVAYCELPFEGHPIRLEYRWLARDRRNAPLVVFVHEGLGSLAMWRDYPQRLCDAGGFRGLVFSRYGYGRSTPRPADERWPVDFMERQADQVLPALFDALEVGADGCAPWLFGHSDGGSIALIYAAHRPQAVAGLITVAPHIMVEDLSIASIAATREAYLGNEFRKRLARYHADPDSAFFGAGTTPGWTRGSARGRSRLCFTICAARCWPYRARTTSTARWPRSRASGSAFRGAKPQSSRNAVIRRIAISLRY